MLETQNQLVVVDSLEEEFTHQGELLGDDPQPSESYENRADRYRRMLPLWSELSRRYHGLIQELEKTGEWPKGNTLKREHFKFMIDLYTTFLTILAMSSGDRVDAIFPTPRDLVLRVAEEMRKSSEGSVLTAITEIELSMGKGKTAV